VAGEAEPALAARPREPRHADPLAGGEPHPAGDDLAHDLVAKYERELRPVELTVDDVEIRAADAARVHAKQYLSSRRLRIRKIRGAKRLACRVENHRAHHARY
jgi:hypothetical protein